MLVCELRKLLETLPQNVEVRMEVANKACSVVRSVDYDWDGKQGWITLNDYPGTISDR